MAVIIRMKRTGRKHHPCYRISVADSRKPRDGRTIENLGVYDPLSPLENTRVSLNVERAKHWLAMGALPSRTVRTVFKGQGLFEGEAAPTKRDRSGRKKKTATRTTKRQAKAAGLVAKETRRNQRIADKAAAKAAAAETSEE
ncbi:MAG: small subunit ribosomal protein S16 [Planctomycetota bacterium]|jgi:small subunit ribosomal protein S16